MDKIQPNKEGYREAVKRIKDCAESGDNQLDLSFLGLTFLPPEIQMLKSLTQLDCSNNRLTSLAGIETLTALTQLNCNYNQLTSLAGIGTLTALNQIYCYSNQLTSLAGIGTLTALNQLNCSSNHLTSLAGIETLTALNQIYCNSNQLTSLADIESLTALNQIYCNSNQLTSLAGIETLTALNQLKCNYNQLTSLAGIETLTTLNQLSCNSNQLTSLTGIETLTALYQLDCSNNRLTSLADIETLNTLNQLNCSSNQLTSLTGIETLTALNQLSCSSNQLTSLEGIESLTVLNELNCNYNRLTCLAGIESLTELNELNCNYNRLTSLAGIRTLKALTKLDCHSNQLTSLEGIKTLKALTKLDCHSNQLTSLEGIKTLTALTKLDCNANQLTSLAGIETLTELNQLNCSYNQITSLAGIETLTALTQFDCRKNQLTSLAGIETLIVLTQLHCSNNRLTSLAGIKTLTVLTQLDCGDNQLTSLAEIETLRSLKLLLAKSNPVKGVPHAFLNYIDELRAYWRDIENTGAEANTCGKLLFLGNGRVGKTTLCHALVEDKSQTDKPACVSTEGICLMNWTLPGVGEQDWQVSIWDFGGQEIYHATHRLFHSQEGVYCVLWAEETDESEEEVQHPLRYWLDLVADNNTECPVIVVKNQTDRSDSLGLNNESLEDERYCNLPHYGVSALHNRRTGPLRAEIMEQFRALSALNVVLPRSWLRVRDKLSAVEQPAITRIEFENLCEQDTHSDTLLHYLHKTGAVFYQPDCFDGRIFLDQNWVLTAVYRLFEKGKGFFNVRQRIEGKRGRITGQDLLEIYSDYNRNEISLFTDFMQQSRMVFSLSNEDMEFEKRIWIVPGLLPQEPLVSSHEMDLAEYQYQLIFPWLHRLAIERLLIACHRLSATDHWWRNGMKLFLDSKVTCYLSADTTERTLHLALKGNEADVKTFLPRILKTIEETRVAAPEKDRLRIGQNDWLDKESTYDYMKRHRWFSSEHQIKAGALAYFYLKESTDEGVESIPPSSPLHIKELHAQTVYVNSNNSTGNNMTENKIENSPGAVLAGGSITGPVKINVTIGGTEQEKSNRLEETQALLQLLKSSDLNPDDSDTYNRYLENVEEELKETAPDTSIIKKQLNRFSGILDKVEKGQALYTRVVGFLAGFGIVM